MTESIRRIKPMRTGPPWRYETPHALEKVIDEYFNQTTKEEITRSGLCMHINLGKDALIAYGNRGGYEEIVMMAKLKIENAYETSLREKGGAGNIFALKNFGWIDKQEHEHSGSATNPLITKIIREVVNVKQIEHIEHIASPESSEEITDDSRDDFSEDSGLPAGLDDLADEFDDFLQ